MVVVKSFASYLPGQKLKALGRPLSRLKQTEASCQPQGSPPVPEWRGRADKQLMFLQLEGLSGKMQFEWVESLGLRRAASLGEAPKEAEASGSANSIFTELQAPPNQSLCSSRALLGPPQPGA